MFQRFKCWQSYEISLFARAMHSDNPNGMLGMFAYAGVCLVVAAIITLIYALTRPIKDRGEMKTWRVLLTALIVVGALPYGWCEALTRLYGKNMQAPVEGVIQELQFNGGLRYFRILSYNGKKARVVAVGQDNQDWGGTEQPVVAINLVKSGNRWTAESYNVVNSLARNKDSYTLPPFW